MSLTDPRTFRFVARRAIALSCLTGLGPTAAASSGCGYCNHEMKAVYAVTGEQPQGSLDPMSCVEHGCARSIADVSLSSCTLEGSNLHCHYTGGSEDLSDTLEEVDEAECSEACAGVLEGTVLGCLAVPDGHRACLIRGGCVGGRGFEGMPTFVSEEVDHARALGEMAHLEACSVTAFEVLAGDLEALGAPPHLVRRARAAARDEARHQALLLAMARARGFRGQVEIPPPPQRRIGLAALAEENMIEGCVREAWGSLVVTWMSRLCPAQRTTLRGIARDEARHASLAWAVHYWAIRSLSAAARRRLHAARDQALRELGPDPALLCLGVGETAQRRALATLGARLVA